MTHSNCLPNANNCSRRTFLHTVAAGALAAATVNALLPRPALAQTTLTPDAVLQAFGPRRLMFGSDWPVVLLAASYQRWVTTVAGAIRQLTTDEQARIFDRFYRVRRPETEGIDGTGLGLAIVKRLIERSGGEIRVVSGEADGSRIYFTLPAAVMKADA